MRETRADTRRAVASALVLHGLLFALMFAGMWWTRTATPVSAAGPVIEADLVDPRALSAPMRAALDEEALVQRVASFRNQDQDLAVFVAGDSAVPYGEVLRVLQRLRTDAKVDKATLLTQSPEPK